MTDRNYSRNVFLNCPFDDEYQQMFYAMIFTIYNCGYFPRCAMEIEDGGETRISKIFNIISECKFGIHDISRTELSEGNGLPRFNMPLELGMYLSAKRFGDKKQKIKTCLVLDREQYRYQIYISDIAGQDIRSHDNDPLVLIPIVRNWLRNQSGRTTIIGGAEICQRYEVFVEVLPQLCEELHLTIDELIFNDFRTIIEEWLKAYYP
jgi:hypothetical protein